MYQLICIVFRFNIKTLGIMLPKIVLPETVQQKNFINVINYIFLYLECYITFTKNKLA